MNIKVGVTATRAGINELQLNRVYETLKTYRVSQLRHGDCLGGDAQIHAVAVELGIDVIIHPPIKDSLRAYCSDAKLVLPPKNYLSRNHDIVNACDMLIVVPREQNEILHSGTWATFRYAQQKQTIINLILPDGSSSVMWPDDD